MNKLFITCVAFVAVSLLGGCAQQKDAAAPDLLCKVCVVSGEPLEADAPTSAYNGGKVGFCCEKCQGKWAKMDATGQKASFDANSKK